MTYLAGLATIYWTLRSYDAVGASGQSVSWRQTHLWLLSVLATFAYYALLFRFPVPVLCCQTYVTLCSCMYGPYDRRWFASLAYNSLVGGVAWIQTELLHRYGLPEDGGPL